MTPWSHCLILVIGALSLLTATGTMAAPACKGPNKNDPGCPGAESEAPEAPAVAATAVHSATVDWANEKIIVRGSSLDAVTTFHLGGSGPLAVGASSPTQVELPFDTSVAGEVTEGGTYALQIDGADAISIYFISSVIDPALDGCPCEGEWIAELGGLWGADETACYEVTAAGTADLAGTILSSPGDTSVYPQYPIGAAYYAGDPVSSVCRLVEVNDTNPFTQDLVNTRINASQQSDCASLLQANVCGTTEPAVLP